RQARAAAQPAPVLRALGAFAAPVLRLVVLRRGAAGFPASASSACERAGARAGAPRVLAAGFFAAEDFLAVVDAFGKSGASAPSAALAPSPFSAVSDLLAAMGFFAAGFLAALRPAGASLGLKLIAAGASLG